MAVYRQTGSTSQVPDLSFEFTEESEYIIRP